MNSFESVLTFIVLLFVVSVISFGLGYLEGREDEEKSIRPRGANGRFVKRSKSI